MHPFSSWQGVRMDRFTRRIAAGGLSLLVVLSGWSLARADDEQKLEPIVVGAPERIEVFPAQFKLGSTRAEMHLAVTGYYPGGGVQDLTRAAEIISTNEQVVKLAGGIARPVANGKAELVVRVGGKEVKVLAEVSGQETPERVSFNYGTLAALSKQGCNQGACHGSPSGKGGFRLSLRAYDPVVDTLTLVRESYNRRTNVYEPETSLLLQKPLMEVAAWRRPPHPHQRSELCDPARLDRSGLPDRSGRRPDVRQGGDLSAAADPAPPGAHAADDRAGSFFRRHGARHHLAGLLLQLG